MEPIDRECRPSWPGPREATTVRPAVCPLVLGVVLLAPVATSAAAPDGESVYRQSCAECHESGENRAPPLEALRQLSPAAILRSLESGTMAYVGETLPAGYADAVAAYLGQRAESEGAREGGSCAGQVWSDPHVGPRWLGWGAGPENSRFQPPELGGLDATSVGRLELRWAFGLPDSDRARAHPAVAGGRVYVGARNGRLYALDAESGCTIWEFEAEAEVRTAVLVAPAESGGRNTIHFGDVKANLYGVDAATGRQLWRTRVEDHEAATLTGSPVLFEGRLYVPASSIEEFTGAFPTYPCCTFRGSIAAYDAINGERIWKTHTIPEEPTPRRPNGRGVVQHGPSGAGIWSAPTIDAKLGRVYVATGDNYSDPPTDDSDAVIAYDLRTGERLWSRQFTEGDAYNMACNPRASGENCPEADGPDFDFGSSPILAELQDGKRILVAGQKSGVVHALDPDRDGAIVWQRRAGEGGKLGGIQFGPAVDSVNAYVAVSDYRGGRRDQGGGLTAIRLADGQVAWHVPAPPCPAGRERCSPAQSAAVTATAGVVFSGSLDGFLRAYSTRDGSLLWSYDTVRDFPGTVNGVPARGGSLNGPGPAIVGGMVYVNSGYGQFGSIPGNAFLAFGVAED